MGAISPILALLVVLFLIVLALRLWPSSCRGGSPPPFPDDGVAHQTRQIGDNIDALRRCPADQKFRAVVVDPLDGLWGQYKALSAQYPDAAAYHLYDALSALESDIVPLSGMICGGSADWREHARRSLLALPRNVRLLGVALQVE